MAIQMPITWGWDRIKDAVQSVGSASPDQYWTDEQRYAGAPVVRRIGMADLRYALARGYEDFGSNRTDVIFLCVLYPLVGLAAARLAFGYGMLPLLFPFAAGFAQPDAPAHDLRNREAGAQLVEELRRKAHGDSRG